jgi:hypothetical protein
LLGDNADGRTAFPALFFADRDMLGEGFFSF